jgi:predicted membrane channel-forming protein YqfA (hemolysin III family)
VAAQETKAEQLEREHEELFHELRATIPGAEVLFAFLLTVAFTNRFDELTPVQRDVYYSTFLCSATALVLLLAPSAYHRIQFRRHDKENMLRLANKEALAGTILIAFSITGAGFLITDILFASKWASLAAGVLAALAGALWWALPLSRRLRDRPQG